MLKDHRFSFYTDLGSYAGWTPWAFSYIDPEVCQWIASGHAVKFNGTMFTDMSALQSSVQT